MNKVGLLACGLLTLSSAQADIRVLFRFDQSGHYLQRVVDIPEIERLKLTTEDSSLTGRSRPNESEELSFSAIDSGRTITGADIAQASEISGSPAKPGFIQLRWMDINGQIIAESQAPDPRITHSPDHIQSAGPSRVALQEGAWLARGPDNAAQVRVILPAQLSLGLGLELWDVPIVRE